MGAFDYLLKGFDHEELRTVVKKALDMYRLKREVSQLQENERKNYPDIAIFGTSPKIKYIKDLIKIVARTPKTSVLIEGESGTGKELVAKAVHNLSSRSDKPLIAINCSAIPENLMESELFGYEKGAFTDAKSLKKGVFELAHCGTLFLDEISSMKLSLQPKLLRVLETQSFRRIGGTSDIKIDVRIIAATNQNLKECVDNGSFREDLYYRLKVMVINLPPLRERVEDIVPMAKMFIEQNNKEFSKNIMGFSKEAEQLMLNFDWPGNVRELKNIMERAVILCQGNVVTEEYLPSELRSAKPKDPKPISYQSPTGEALSLQDIEQKHILEILEKFNGNKSKAARVLNISRSTLREKLKQYGIS
jgi:DNA-binding NtrC family response regulator